MVFRLYLCRISVCCSLAVLAACGRTYEPFSQPSGTQTSKKATASAFGVLHVFHSPPRGMNPLAPVVADSSGNLYGETYDGGKPTSGGGCGTVFELSPSGGQYTETTLHRFRNEPDGCLPTGGLSIDSAGAIYGTTAFGGATRGLGAGVVFKLTPFGSGGYAYRVLYRFRDGRDGAWPLGSVVVDSSGVLYGATQYGAAYACAGNTEGCGTVYSLTPNGPHYTEKILHVFKGGNDGLLPIDGLAMDSSGALYGTTWAGGGYGSIGVGTVYKLTPSRSGYNESVIHAFGGSFDGSTPWAPVIVEPNGAVDGTTLYGGKGGGGTVFRLIPSGSTYKEGILYSFGGGDDGSQPEAPVTDEDGTFYGTTTDGGGFPCEGSCGTIFALRPSPKGYAHTVLYRFNSQAGFYPRAGVIPHSGALYGTTYFQGRRVHYGGGTVFKLTL